MLHIRQSLCMYFICSKCFFFNEEKVALGYMKESCMYFVIFYMISIMKAFHAMPFE